MTTLQINGASVTIDPDYEDGLLLWALRDNLGLTGTKFGCGVGICGSCTVQIDGVATRSCLTAVSSVIGQEIRTLEGLSQPDGSLHPVQEAFLEEQVPQCAWCMSGQMMTAVALLEANPTPSREEIIAGMQANYCRCGCYARIRTAVATAAQKMQEAT